VHGAVINFQRQHEIQQDWNSSRELIQQQQQAEQLQRQQWAALTPQQQQRLIMQNAHQFARK